MHQIHLILEMNILIDVWILYVTSIFACCKFIQTVVDLKVNFLSAGRYWQIAC